MNMLPKLFLFCLLAFAAAESDIDPNDSIAADFRGPVPKIVGGSAASEDQFPWQLRLNKNGAFLCGAVLISSTRALTAAHCLRDESSNHYTAVAGQINTGSTSANEATRTVSSWISHPDYEPVSGYPNDIAILKFDTAFPNNDFVSPITVASSGNFTGVMCTVSGWGSTKGGVNPSETLQFADMWAISKADCASRFESVPGATINDAHICAFFGGRSGCFGDTGSPMVCNDKLVGIISWGEKTCSGNYPTVNTRVSSFTQWINDNSDM